MIHLKIFLLAVVMTLTMKNLFGLSFAPCTHTNSFCKGEGLAAAGSLTILLQPANISDCKGNKATFSVTVDGGTGNLHYLWKRRRPGDADFIPFGAKDSTKLPIYNIGVGNDSPDGTLYQVIVSDQTGQVVSTSALLTVNQISGIAPVGIASYTLNQGDNLWLKVLTIGNNPTSYQWIKKYGTNDWRDVSDNLIVTGSRNDQINFNGISVADSGVYKVRVTFPTINGNHCVETSTITRKISVIPSTDTEPPLFLNLSDSYNNLCVNDLIEASWNEALSDLIPDRIDYHELQKSNPLFQLSPTLFSDNVTSPGAMLLHWGIFSDEDHLIPVLDTEGNPLQDCIGQLVDYPPIIRLKKNEAANGSFHLVFWLEDEAGNLTPEYSRHCIHLNISDRPQLELIF